MFYCNSAASKSENKLVKWADFYPGQSNTNSLMMTHITFDDIYFVSTMLVSFVKRAKVTRIN